jgi:hypothetical protein
VVARYQRRLSGPLPHRIDVHVEVPRVAYDKLGGETWSKPSAAIRARVQAARLAGTGPLCNAETEPKMEMPWGSRSMSLEEMVIKDLRSLPVDTQPMVAIPALASMHAAGLANLVDVL